MDKAYEDFFPLQAMQIRAKDIVAKLDALVQDGLIKKENLQGRVLDIGTGYGGSYKALSSYSNDVISVEDNSEIGKALITHGIIPKEKIVILNQNKEPNRWLDDIVGTFDFITAMHLFGQEYDVPIAELHPKLVKRLKKGGQILYTAEQSEISNNNYLSIFRALQKLERTKFVIGTYKIGPDNQIYILTKL